MMKMYQIFVALDRLGFLSKRINDAGLWDSEGQLKNGVRRKAAYFLIDKGQPKGKEKYEPYGFWGYRIPGQTKCTSLCDFAKLYPYYLFEKEPEGQRVVERVLIPLSYLTPENFKWDWGTHYGEYDGPVEEVAERIVPEDRDHCHKCLKSIGKEGDYYTEGFHENPDWYCQHPENLPPPYVPEPEPERQPYDGDTFDDGIPF
jgi:hypothetical protein